MKENPIVSVIMPAYNAERFIEAAIRSVMEQTFQNWELIVLDDGSRDHTRQIIETLAQQDQRIRNCPNERNMGVARTRNRGFDLCRGRYVALLDSDDIWHPEKLEKQLARAQETGAELIFTPYALMDASGAPVGTEYLVPAQVSYSQLLKENVIGCSTVMLSAHLLQNYRFETDFFHEDYVLWLRLLQDGCTAVSCSEVLVNWRYLPNSRSFDKRKSAMNRWRIYRKYLKLPLHKSAFYFAAYAVRGIRKYRKTG